MKKRMISRLLIVCTSFCIVFLFSVKLHAVSGYNASVAANYALRWWNSYNTPTWANYNGSGGDCANFVSQCLYNGGLNMTAGWHWYSEGNRTGSWTYAWALCDYLASSAVGGNKIKNPSASQIEVGDVLFYDWPKDGFGGIEHTAICVEVKNGTPYICQHSSSSNYTSNWTNGTPVYYVVKMGGSNDPTPGKPVLNYLYDTYITGEDIVFTWNDTINTTHYTIWFWKKGADGNWEYLDHTFYATSGISHKFDVGEYRVQLTSTNSNAWTDDGSTWRFTNGDFTYFSVISTDPGKPVLKKLNATYPSCKAITFTWDNTINTTHYNIWFWKKGVDGNWEYLDHTFYADSGLSKQFDIGEYRVQLVSTNSNYWTEDGSSWRFTNGDYVFFNVNDHSWNNGKVTKSATCTSKGQKTYECSVCGKTKVSDISALGHSWESNYRIDKNATCKEAGSKSIHCSRCSATKNVTSIPILTNHSWDAGKVTKAATCSEKGTKSYKCTICGSTKTGEIVALGHSWNSGYTVDKAASCKAEGSKSIHCNRCGAKKDVAVIPKLNHIWDTGKVTKDATVDKEGVKTYTCSICGETKTENIPKKETDPVTVRTEDPAKAPDVKEKEKEILNQKGDEAPAGSTFNLLQVRATKVTNTSIRVQWTKVKGASGYIIYGNKCGQKYKKLKTIKSGKTTSWTQKKLKKGKYYKYFVVAIAKYNGTDKVIASSKTIHIATTGGKIGNHKSVAVTKPKAGFIELEPGKTYQIKAKAVAASSKLKVKNHRALRYESTNPEVASVGAKNGKIKAVSAGTCYVYVYAQNGVFKKIVVIVK